MADFKRKIVEEFIQLNKEITEKPLIKNVLLFKISNSFSSITSKTTTPEIYLEKLLSPLKLGEKKKELEKFKDLYLYESFKEKVQSTNKFILTSTSTFTQIENNPLFKRIVEEVKAEFNQAEKKAFIQYQRAINQIDIKKKRKGLEEALSTARIGGEHSITIVRDMVKMELGYSVGKTELDQEKDQKNTENLKKRNEKKQQVA